MRQGFRVRLAEKRRRLRRILAIWRRRDPKPRVVALMAVAMGFALFLFLLAWVGALYVVSHITRWHH
jgi:hypothetical protein